MCDRHRNTRGQCWHSNEATTPRAGYAALCHQHRLHNYLCKYTLCSPYSEHRFSAPSSKGRMSGVNQCLESLYASLCHQHRSTTISVNTHNAALCHQHRYATISEIHTIQPAVTSTDTELSLKYTLCNPLCITDTELSQKP